MQCSIPTTLVIGDLLSPLVIRRLQSRSGWELDFRWTSLILRQECKFHVEAHELEARVSRGYRAWALDMDGMIDLWLSTSLVSCG